MPLGTSPWERLTAGAQRRVNTELGMADRNPEYQSSFLVDVGVPLTLEKVELGTGAVTGVRSEAGSPWSWSRKLSILLLWRTTISCIPSAIAVSCWLSSCMAPF